MFVHLLRMFCGTFKSMRGSKIGRCEFELGKDKRLFLQMWWKYIILVREIE